jgi:hypothetical protein
MNSRIFTKAFCLVLAITVITLVSHSVATAQVRPSIVYGPCVPATSTAGVPDHCESGCVVYCTDFCSTLVWKAAGCLNQSGSCKRKAQSRSEELCRDCFCTWPFGGCVDQGLYYSGSTSVIDCQ